MKTKGVRLKTLIAAVLAVAVLELIGAAVVRAWHLPPLAALGCLRLLEITALILLAVRCEGGTPGIGIDPGEIPAGIRRGILWSLGFGVIAGLGAFALYVSGINPLLLVKAPLPGSIPDVVLFFLVGGIAGPAAEEIFFRGIVFLFFRRWGFWPAILLSTALFVVLHPLSSGVPLPQIIGGLLFAAAFEIEKNLMVPLTVHITGNLAIFTLSWAAH